MLARAETTVDAANPQLLSNSETGALDDLDLLHSLGLAASTASAVLTVTTRAGTQETVRLPATRSGFITWPDLFVDQVPGLAHVPLPLYRQDASKPYWLRVLAAQHAVYLKYNQCRPDDGFRPAGGELLRVVLAFVRAALPMRSRPFRVSTICVRR